jgi:hypothetical protein
VQSLIPVDFPVQENFFQHFIQCSVQYFFVSILLFTDDAHFDVDSIINIHNQHQEAEKNPQGTIHTRHQQQFSINEWAGTVWKACIFCCINL